MKFLAIDTSTEACSVALSCEGIVSGLFEICPQQHSQRLLPMVQEVLQQAEIRLAELDFLAFGRGPGSFTGVRIATGMIQGLSLGTQLPVVGVSTLAAMAQQAIEKHDAQAVNAMHDARMQEVYFGHFVNRDGLAVLDNHEQVLAPELARQQLVMPAVNVGTGWQNYAALTDVVNEKSVLYPNALYMLSLAKAEFEAGHFTSAEQVQPVYLRDKVTWKKLPGRE